MDLYRRVRRAHFVEAMSIRRAARMFNLHRSTVSKMLEYSAPPGYQRQQPPHRPKLGPYNGSAGGRDGTCGRGRRRAPLRSFHRALRATERVPQRDHPCPERSRWGGEASSRHPVASSLPGPFARQGPSQTGLSTKESTLRPCSSWVVVPGNRRTERLTPGRRTKSWTIC